MFQIQPLRDAYDTCDVSDFHYVLNISNVRDVCSERA
jgi:hypothetical protein